jgi:hypothetical protein
VRLTFARRDLQGPHDRRRARRRESARFARARARVRRETGALALELSHHSAAWRAWLRHLAEGRVGSTSAAPTAGRA